MIDQSTFKHAEMGTSVHDIVRVLIMCLEQCAVAVLSAHILSTHHIIPSPSFNILWTVHGKCAVCKLSDLYRSTAIMHMHWLLSIV